MVEFAVFTINYFDICHRSDRYEFDSDNYLLLQNSQ